MVKAKLMYPSWRCHICKDIHSTKKQGDRCCKGKQGELYKKKEAEEKIRQEGRDEIIIDTINKRDRREEIFFKAVIIFCVVVLILYCGMMLEDSFNLIERVVR